MRQPRMAPIPPAAPVLNTANHMPAKCWRQGWRAGWAALEAENADREPDPDLNRYVAMIGPEDVEIIDSAQLAEAYRELWPATGEEQVTLYVRENEWTAELVGPLHQSDTIVSADDAFVYHQTTIATPDGRVVEVIVWDVTKR